MPPHSKIPFRGALKLLRPRGPRNDFARLLPLACASVAMTMGRAFQKPEGRGDARPKRLRRAPKARGRPSAAAQLRRAVIPWSWLRRVSDTAVTPWILLRRESNTGSCRVQRDSVLGCSSQEKQRNDAHRNGHPANLSLITSHESRPLSVVVRLRPSAYSLSFSRLRFSLCPLFPPCLCASVVKMSFPP